MKITKQDHKMSETEKTDDGTKGKQVKVDQVKGQEIQNGKL